MIGTAVCIGAGIMGHSIAQVFAGHGWQVLLVDKTVQLAEAGVINIRRDLSVAATEGVIDASDIEGVLSYVRPSTSIPESVARADLVMECVSEDLEAKTAVWKRIGASAHSKTILCSNTSSFDIDALAEASERPTQVIGTHWYNPPQIVPCVEVVPGDATNPSVTQQVIEILDDLGKSPAVVKNVPGFVGNRIQLAMAAEAFRCLEEGVASAHDIDMIVKSSFAFRLDQYGPLEIADLNGLDTYLAVYDYLERSYKNERFRAPAILRQLTQSGRLGLKTLGGIYSYDEASANELRQGRDARLYRKLAALSSVHGEAIRPGMKRQSPKPDAGTCQAE